MWQRRGNGKWSKLWRRQRRGRRRGCHVLLVWLGGWILRAFHVTHSLRLWHRAHVQPAIQEQDANAIIEKEPVIVGGGYDKTLLVVIGVWDHPIQSFIMYIV